MPKRCFTCGRFLDDADPEWGELDVQPPNVKVTRPPFEHTECFTARIIRDFPQVVIDHPDHVH